MFMNTDRQLSDRQANTRQTDITVHAQADSQPEVPWRLPWRTSMDEGRPSFDSSGGVRRRLSRAAQSLPPIDSASAGQQHEVIIQFPYPLTSNNTSTCESLVTSHAVSSANR